MGNLELMNHLLIQHSLAAIVQKWHMFHEKKASTSVTVSAK